jgi:hypothetical protein
MPDENEYVTELREAYAAQEVARNKTIDQLRDTVKSLDAAETAEAARQTWSPMVSMLKALRRQLLVEADAMNRLVERLERP